jgi:hypothetical protein
MEASAEAVHKNSTAFDASIKGASAPSIRFPDQEARKTLMRFENEDYSLLSHW